MSTGSSPPQTLSPEPSGGIPNCSLPVLVYRDRKLAADIAAVPLPRADPVHGSAGPLGELWGR